MKALVGIVLFKNEPSEVERNIKVLRKSIAYAKSVRPELDITVTLFNNHKNTEYGDVGRYGASYMESNDNLGFGRAHNQMMRSAFGEGADVYIMMNPDGFPEVTCISEMLSMCEKENVGMVEAIQFPMEHPKPWDKVTFETPWCSGACTLITLEAYIATSGFDENFWLYCEDVDISWRLTYSGFRLLVAPLALFIHDTETRNSPSVRRSMLEAARYLAKKWTAPQFQQYVEACLVKEGFVAEAVYLPPIKEPRQYFSADYPAEFRQLFSFAVPRW